MAILKKAPLLDLCSVLPIKERIIKTYTTQVKDTWSLKTVFNTNQGYKTCRFPVVKVKGGHVLNLKCRFFTEDVPYGLCILKDMATLLGVKTPNIDRMLEFHQKFMDRDFIKDGKLLPEIIPLTGSPTRYGIKSAEQMIALACQQSEMRLKVSPKL